VGAGLCKKHFAVALRDTRTEYYQFSTKCLPNVRHRYKDFCSRTLALIQAALVKSSSIHRIKLQDFGAHGHRLTPPPLPGLLSV
jgi:hypothetical protein